jgi:hypothetical protein
MKMSTMHSDPLFKIGQWTNGEVTLGRMPDFGWQKAFAGPIHHMPYAVRTDVVKQLSRVLNRSYHSTWSIPVANDGTLIGREHPNLASLPRSKEFAHFWPRQGNGIPTTSNSQLRNQVSETLFNLSQSNNLSSLVDLAGVADEGGRREAHFDYAAALLTYKIVVVTQRDRHEDHYRLMEALCGGSLVMTDYMLSLPEGLQDGQHLVMFSGMEEMRRKVLYYLQNDDERLQIAQAGYSEVMNHHRSWHRVEEFILKHVT